MKQVINGKEYEMTASHSERDIYEGCIALMESLVGSFEQYLEYIGVDLKDEAPFNADFRTTEIVERLFLWKTAHSGGTSQSMKCRELGIDPWETVRFEFGNDEEEE